MSNHSLRIRTVLASSKLWEGSKCKYCKILDLIFMLLFHNFCCDVTKVIFASYICVNKKKMFTHLQAPLGAIMEISFTVDVSTLQTIQLIFFTPKKSIIYVFRTEGLRQIVYLYTSNFKIIFIKQLQQNDQRRRHIRIRIAYILEQDGIAGETEILYLLVLDNI